MSKPQVYVAKGSSPWYNNSLSFWAWMDRSHVVNVDSSTSEATVTCDGNITNMCRMFGDECYSLTSIDL